MKLIYLHLVLVFYSFVAQAASCEGNVQYAELISANCLDEVNCIGHKIKGIRSCKNSPFCATQLVLLEKEIAKDCQKDSKCLSKNNANLLRCMNNKLCKSATVDKIDSIGLRDIEIKAQLLSGDDKNSENSSLMQGPVETTVPIKSSSGQSKASILKGDPTKTQVLAVPADMEIFDHEGFAKLMQQYRQRVEEQKIKHQRRMDDIKTNWN